MKIRLRTFHRISNYLKKERENTRKSSFSKEGSDEPFCQKLKSVTTNKIFVCLCISLSGLYFVVTGIQFWASDYLKIIIEVNEHVVSIYFTTTCFTAPVGGVIVGGIITTAFGGYNTKKSFKLMRFVSILAVACALPIPYFSSFAVVGSLIWLLLFFGGFILPPLTGVMISSVGQYQKS